MAFRREAVASLYTRTGHRKYLTPAERAAFIAAAKVQTRREVALLCLTIAYTGCRISEALRLRVSNIEVEAGFIAIRSLKKRNGAIVIREIPAPTHLLIKLERFCRSQKLQPDEYLWPLCRSRAWQLVKLVMSEAGIAPGIHATPKGLRHGFGIHAIRSGVPLNLVQRWLGHASITTTAIYLQAMGIEEREIAARMW